MIEQLAPISRYGFAGRVGTGLVSTVQAVIAIGVGRTSTRRIPGPRAISAGGARGVCHAIVERSAAGTHLEDHNGALATDTFADQTGEVIGRTLESGTGADALGADVVERARIAVVAAATSQRLVRSKGTFAIGADLGFTDGRAQCSDAFRVRRTLTRSSHAFASVAVVIGRADHTIVAGTRGRRVVAASVRVTCIGCACLVVRRAHQVAPFGFCLSNIADFTRVDRGHIAVLEAGRSDLAHVCGGRVGTLADGVARVLGAGIGIIAKRIVSEVTFARQPGVRRVTKIAGIDGWRGLVEGRCGIQFDVLPRGSRIGNATGIGQLAGVIDHVVGRYVDVTTAKKHHGGRYDKN